MADVDAVARVASAMWGARGRSPLYQWLWENYAELERARLESPGRSDWIKAAAEMNKLGIRTRGGKRLTAETVRRTWARVATDARASGKMPAPPLRPPTSAPEPLLAEPAHSDDIEFRTLRGTKL
jgi:hypothetical protein